MASTPRFCWYDLRTTDVDGAAAFYGDVMGWATRPAAGGSRLFLSGETPCAGLGELPARARAAGAPPHWAGQIAVDDVDETVRRLEAWGAQRRGGAPGEPVVMRDAQGAVLVIGGARATASTAVVWHELHTTDRAAAWAAYSDLFGWREVATVDLGPPVGLYQTFTWEPSGRPAGAMTDLARSPTVHTHWFLHFAVADLDRALARVRALGGVIAAGPLESPSGARVAVCDDPQGAAFALKETRPEDP